MFDSPNWLGSFITSQTNKEINDLQRKHDVIMEDIKHKHEYLIQSSKNAVTENVAKANRESNEEIERLKRVHEAEIANARNKNAIAVALIQAASNTAGKAIPYVFPAFLAGKASNSNSNTKGSGNSRGASSNPQPVTVTKADRNAEESKKRADDLFPELEPTFGVTLMNGDELSTKINSSFPKINVTQLAPALGAVLSIAAPIMAIL